MPETEDIAELVTKAAIMPTPKTNKVHVSLTSIMFNVDYTHRRSSSKE
jgi:hypothetical protein